MVRMRLIELTRVIGGNRGGNRAGCQNIFKKGMVLSIESEIMFDNVYEKYFTYEKIFYMTDLKILTYVKK